MSRFATTTKPANAAITIPKPSSDAVFINASKASPIADLLPSATEVFDVGRIVVASWNRDGFGHNPITGDDVSNKKIDVARLNLGAYIKDDLNVQFAADRLNEHSGVCGAQMLAPHPLPPFFPQPRTPSRRQTAGMIGAQPHGAAAGRHHPHCRLACAGFGTFFAVLAMRTRIDTIHCCSAAKRGVSIEH